MRFIHFASGRQKFHGFNFHEWLLIMTREKCKNKSNNHMVPSNLRRIFLLSTSNLTLLYTLYVWPLQYTESWVEASEQAQYRLEICCLLFTFLFCFSLVFIVSNFKAYSWKYWQSLNLAVWPKTDCTKVNLEFKATCVVHTQMYYSKSCMYQFVRRFDQ